MTRRSFGSIRKLPSGRWQARYRDPISGEGHPAPETSASKTDGTLAKRVASGCPNRSPPSEPALTTGVPRDDLADLRRFCGRGQNTMIAGRGVQSTECCDSVIRLVGHADSISLRK